MRSHLTQCGIPGIGVVPYGFHMCHFYSSRQELLDPLIPYFRAGLNNGERCLWIASSPLQITEVASEIIKHPELEQGISSGELKIFDAVEWYGHPATLAVEKIVQRFIDEEERAIADGYQALRVAGNTSFMPRAHWELLMEYESKLHAGLRDRRVLACCSYNRLECRPIDILEVVRRHDATLDRTDDDWEIFLRNSDPFREGKIRERRRPEIRGNGHDTPRLPV